MLKTSCYKRILKRNSPSIWMAIWELLAVVSGVMWVVMLTAKLWRGFMLHVGTPLNSWWHPAATPDNVLQQVPDPKGFLKSVWICHNAGVKLLELSTLQFNWCNFLSKLSSLISKIWSFFLSYSFFLLKIRRGHTLTIAGQYFVWMRFDFRVANTKKSSTLQLLGNL